MNKKINDILQFRCPRWEELPDKRLLSSQLIDYINDSFGTLFPEETVLTKSMIQNYFKWEILPVIEGKKYSREQIAYLIVISIYKQVIPIKDIKKGVLLQQNLTGLEASYNHFAEVLEQSLREIFSGPGESDFVIVPERRSRREYLGIDTVTYAFSFQLLGRMILEANGTSSIAERGRANTQSKEHNHNRNGEICDENKKSKRKNRGTL